jgi:hypothetical protein
MNKYRKPDSRRSGAQCASTGELDWLEEGQDDDYIHCALLHDSVLDPILCAHWLQEMWADLVASLVPLLHNPPR